MSISPGTKLGSFEIAELIGQGGMGQVYRALDPKLERDVAIKILPEAFAFDDERLGRFNREARLLASMDHPNICAVHDLQHEDGIHFMVMPLIEGDTLAERIGRGAIPLDQILSIFAQIAEALEAAHEHGIIHRDLKPGNVKVGDDGRVKVLDFGLGKEMEPDQRPVSGSAPTRPATPDSTRMSKEGVILGTPVYMSPEQARGKPVDKRTDIWAFGCCLYEALTGKVPFEGETVSDTLAKVLERDPDFEALPKDTPWRVRELIENCLEKDPRYRLRDIGDAWATLRRMITESGRLSPAAGATTGPRVQLRPKTVLLASLFLIIGGVVAALAIVGLRPSESRPVQRFSIVPKSENIARVRLGGLDVSESGSNLVFVARPADVRARLFVRSVDQRHVRELAGTDGARHPFFSPDGQWIAFFSLGKLNKVSINGAAVLSLAEASDSRGGDWGPEDSIVYAPDATSGLFIVPAGGGTPQKLTELDPQRRERSHRWPQFLPGGDSVLFTIKTTGNLDEADIAVLSLKTGTYRTVLKGGSNPRYLASGHVAFGHNGVLMAFAFDTKTGTRAGPPGPVIDALLTDSSTGLAAYSVSNAGLLVYAPGTGSRTERSLFWVDLEGKAEPIPAPKRYYGRVALSPDGTRLATADGSGGASSDIWVYEFARGTLTRLTFEGINNNPVWTADSRRIVFNSDRGGGRTGVYWKPADGSGPAEPLVSSEYPTIPMAISADNQTFLFMQIEPETGVDLWSLSLSGEAEPKPFLQTPFLELAPTLSPDGRWVAYMSNESGSMEVYVRAFPGPGGKWQISSGGGGDPIWSKDGASIHFRNGDLMMRAAVQTEPTFSTSTPEVVFERHFLDDDGWQYDVAGDGQRYVIIEEGEEQSGPLTFRAVTNWFTELERLVPTR